MPAPPRQRRNKHHFLARHHLAHFATTDGLLYVYDREQGWAERRDIPERLAVERFLYAPEASDETGRDPKDDAVEVWLADVIDTPAAAPLAKLANGDDLASLSESERHAMADYLAVLDMRTPRVRDILVENFAAAGKQAIRDDKATRRALLRNGVRTTRGEVRRLSRQNEASILKEQAKPGWLEFIQTTRHLARINVKARRWSLLSGFPRMSLLSTTWA